MYYFEIYGTQIPLSSIKNFRLVQKEYIYRPSYREVTQTFLGFATKSKYEFAEMIPYAAILDDDEYTLATKKARAITVKDSVIKDVAVGLISQAATRFNIKELKYKKYKCVNIAGRVFECFLEEVPAVIVRGDGKISEVHKHDELYSLLGESIAPAIYFVPAIQISADEDYTFYGNNIQFQDVVPEYNRLKIEMEQYRNSELSRMQAEIEYKQQKSLGSKLSGVAKKFLPKK